MPNHIDPFPHLHVRPARGWVNDPNGIGHWDGRWHVMYQWNPNAPEHGDIHWGHMSSPDMLAWRDDGIAMQPRAGQIDAAGVWSGVAVQEAGGVALVYSAIRSHARDACVAVARPTGDGTWAQPHHPAAEHPDHTQWADVRDPFILTVGGRRLGIMGAGRAGQESSRRGAVLVYDATDLDRWRLLGPLVAADQLPAGMIGRGAYWECPQLVPLGDRWLLVVSWDDGPGVPARAADGTPMRRLGVVGYVGELDLSGTAPRFSAQTELALDHGPDFYAPQLVADGDRVLAWGWSWEGRGAGTNHRSAADIVECGWAGTLTFPREVVLTESGIAMCIPARELTGLVGEPITARQTESGWELRTSTPAWTLAAVDGVQLDLVDAATGHVRQVWSTAQPGEVRLFVDGSIIEIFNSDGSTTTRAYPAEGEAWRARCATQPHAATLRTP